MKKVCRHCRRKFAPSPRVKEQEYCGRPKCRRAWKRKWQRKKRAKDTEYKENQASAQKAWQERHPEYSQEYRRRNPDYAEKNRIKQRERNRSRRKSSNEPVSRVIAERPPAPLAVRVAEVKNESISRVIAKMDSINHENADPIVLTPGRYCMIPVVDGSIAKMDSIIVEISPISAVAKQIDVGGP